MRHPCEPHHCSFDKSMILSSSNCLWPHSSTCASRFLVIMLAVSVSVVPSINSTPYDLVSINGFPCFIPIGLTSFLSLLLLTS